jgi:hypothetical protein
MIILAECPICPREQATKNKACKCGEDLDKAKRSKRVKYSNIWGLALNHNITTRRLL